jgi:hypothetical protein
MLTFHRESKRVRYSKKKGAASQHPRALSVGRWDNSRVHATVHTVMSYGRFPSIAEFQGDKNHRQGAKNKQAKPGYFAPILARLMIHIGPINPSRIQAHTPLIQA